MRTYLVLAALLAAGPAAAGEHDLPDPNLTPGAVNTTVTQDNIGQTICVHGWTKTIRPPVSHTNKLKVEQMSAYGYDVLGTEDVEEDHRVPLGCGGNPTDPRNLWPEMWEGPRGAHAKDRLEAALHRDVCAGRITLAECQAIFLGDWWREYDRRFGEPTAER